jgi:hypothetical protein
MTLAKNPQTMAGMQIGLRTSVFCLAERVCALIRLQKSKRKAALVTIEASKDRNESDDFVRATAGSEMYFR